MINKNLKLKKNLLLFEEFVEKEKVIEITKDNEEELDIEINKVLLKIDKEKY